MTDGFKFKEGQVCSCSKECLFILEETWKQQDCLGPVENELM